MDEDTEEGYSTLTYYDHIVAEYANMPITAVGELEIIDYLILRRDAYITRLRQTPKGQEYLKKAYMLEQTEPDRKKLRETFGRKEVNNG